MKTIKALGSFLLVMGLSIACQPQAGATMLFNDYQWSAPDGPSVHTYANEFQVGLQPLMVTKLGVFATVGLQLGKESLVGIWRVSDEKLIGSAVVSAQVPYTKVDEWFMVSVDPFVLDAGALYRIGAQNGASDIGWGGSYRLGEGIERVSGGFYITQASSRGVYPSELGTNMDGFGAAFTANAEITPVPEPEEWAMLLAGLLVVGFIAARRNARED